MKVLVFNCGSSTLKFEFFNVATNGSDPIHKLARGLADRIGQEGLVEFSAADGQTLREPATLTSHGEAVHRVLAWLDSAGLIGAEGIDAVGHRVVHGGDRFSESTIIDEQVIAGIEAVTQLAPLHNGPSLQAIRAVRDALGPSVPMVAVFDTAFHRTMPKVASRYAIPPELADQHHIQRYGFHGIAHRYMAQRYAAVAGRPLAELKLVTLQLGNGCSAAAISGGHSLDTSMGLTPLEGLIMGTRSGDVDPALPGFLAQREGVPVEEVEGWLNHRSGLLGVSGRSMEVGLDPAMPTYSGGLGVLSGDTLRAAADLRVPLVAVTLLHRKGYFRQSLDRYGNQSEAPYDWSPEQFLEPLRPRVSVTIEGRRVRLRAWRYPLKGVNGHTVPVYFLDAALPENSAFDQSLTDNLYAGDTRYRLCQETVLGMGGIAMLREIGHRDMAGMVIGNAIGSVLTNTFLILGVASLMAPIMVSNLALRYAIPWFIGVTLLLLVFKKTDLEIRRVEGISLCALYIVFIIGYVLLV